MSEKVTKFERAQKRKQLWQTLIPGNELTNQRMEGESFADYKARLKSNGQIIKILLRPKPAKQILIPQRKVSSYASMLLMQRQAAKDQELREQLQAKLKEEEERKKNTPREL